MNGSQENGMCVDAQNVNPSIGTKKKYYLPGLMKGWEHQKNKKLPPKPCIVCGANVYYKKVTQDRAKYCSVKCKGMAQIGIKQKIPKPKTGQYFNCIICGGKFYRCKSHILAGKTLFCSFACRKAGGYTKQGVGCKAHGWKGGIQSDKKGYLREYAPDHPFNSRKYVAQHRLVMERHLHRYLLPTEKVHHINGIKDDNRIENLMIVVDSPHKAEIRCPHCLQVFFVR